MPINIRLMNILYLLDLKIDEHVESLKEKVKAFIEAQIPYKNPIWIKSVDNRLGNDVVVFVKDIERSERNGRNRDTTWGEGKSKVEKRRVKNTMGYMSQMPSPSLRLSN